MHMVCEEHEEAYWNGSKGVCCNGNIYQKAENEYACCPVGQFVKNISGSSYQICCAEDYLSGYILDDVVMCCSNNPNAAGQEKQCCTNGGEWILTQQNGSCNCNNGDAPAEINIQETIYSCGGQQYCDVNSPGSQWLLSAELCTYGPLYFKRYDCIQEEQLTSCDNFSSYDCCGYFYQ